MKTGPHNVAAPRFQLISCTADPIETLMAVWITSRPSQYVRFLDWVEGRWNRRIPTAYDVKEGMGYYEIWTGELELAESKGASAEYLSQRRTWRDAIGLTPRDVEEVFKKVVAMDIPVSECVHLTWGFENMPITWREQAVRERQHGFWMTSSREFSQADFFDEGRFLVAPSVEQDDLRLNIVQGAYKLLQQGYRDLIEMGVPQEDARNILPCGLTHNGTMFETLRTLMRTVSKRSCWIAQVDLWGPVVQGVAKELRQVHPLLGLIITPPCFRRFSDDYQGCKFVGINENRCEGRDPYMPCPIYLEREVESPATPEEVWGDIVRDAPEREPYLATAKRHLPIWGRVWGRNPVTGKLFSGELK